MEGYDKPHYTNTTYPWEGHESLVPGQIPEKFNPVASYVKYFTVPERMEGKPLYISFQGVESGFALWLNGQYVGYSENSFDPAEFELTQYIRKGENKLSVRVWKWTSGSWCEDQDFFRFSGIFRDVYLFTVPKSHLWDVSLVPTLSEDFATGTLTASFKTEGSGKIKLTMLDALDYSLEKNSYKTPDTVLSEEIAIGDGTAEGAFEIKNPKLWSAEQPNIYVLIIEVFDENKERTEILRQDVGFRHFEMKDGLMCLNGKRIVFKGVNRHEFSSVVGRVPVREDIIKDIVTMKRNNINAIRTSHYPDDTLLYHLCDRYGLYMIAENNMESHGTMEAFERGEIKADGIVPNDNPKWLSMMIDRVNSCYQRDKNHPAILIWSCGNESSGGKVIYEMSEQFRKLDKHRLVHYEGVFHDRRFNNTSDMESQMYPTVAMIEEFLAEHKDKPFICCEYTHAMGNSCGAMHKYTDLSDREPRYQGGFIWDYVDQSIYKKNRYGEWFLAYGGDFGKRPNDGNFSGNGIVYGGDREPSPKMQEVKFNYQNITVEPGENSFTVINKNLFINTSVYAGQILLEVDGKEILRNDISCDVDPLKMQTFDYPEEVKTAMKWVGERGELAVTVSFVLKEDAIWAKRGHEVAFGQYVAKKEYKKHSCTLPVTLINGYNNIGVKGENFSAIFSKMNMGLVSYVYGGVEMIEQVPLPNFWRAPVDNDLGSLMPQRYAQWKIASLYLTTRSTGRFENNLPEVEELTHSVKVTYSYIMPTTPESSCKVCYEVFGDGTIETTLSYDPVAELSDMPEFGIMFKLNADYDTVKWYGLGEAETYADRQRGAKLGLYENKVGDNLAGYLKPQECGNHCGVRRASVVDNKGRGMEFFGDELSVNVLPYTPHELENAAHAFELPPVHYTVVRVAEAQMGVGGDDSWGSKVHPEYLLDVSKKKVFTFAFRGV
jgi:beta-galactosidase